MAAMVVGCGSSASSNTEGSTGTPPTANATEKKFKIGVSIPAADHGWTAGVKYWADEESKKHPEVEFDIQTADTPAKQIIPLIQVSTACLFLDIRRLVLNRDMTSLDGQVIF